MDQLRRHLTLGLESSCDETAAAVVADGVTPLANVIASQVALHRRYGGVVPELAARRHLEAVVPLVGEALAQAGIGWDEVDLIAATRGPGLPGALLVGLAVAKGIAFARGLPFVGVNHLAGHLQAHVLTGERLAYPAVGLVVSGSHTDLCLLPRSGELRLLGGTRDDAAGEAFDKVARLLGLPYPGGPAIDRLAAAAAGGRVVFPRGLADSPYEFSFSGLKTAVAVYLEQHPEAERAEVARGFQEAVVGSLAAKVERALVDHRPESLVLAGGVAANSVLRARLAELAARRGVRLTVPPPALCTDNAAMIAAAGYAAWSAGRSDAFDLDVDPNLPLEL